VSIGRALISNPEYLVADEPTSTSTTSRPQVFNIFQNLNRWG
jgi:ABC-type ATPase involved in cell division